MIVGLMEDEAREVVRDSCGVEELDISALLVYEVRFPSIPL